MPKKMPSHWGKDGGDPTPPCEFVVFATWAFGPIPPGRHLGTCDGQVPMPMRVERPSVGKGPFVTFKVCSVHRGLAVETEAEKVGDYRVIQ
jgi:hypothetical protein